MPAKDRESENRQDARIRDYFYAFWFIVGWMLRIIFKDIKR